MKKSNRKHLLLLLANIIIMAFAILIIASTGTRASHISAGNITYQSQGAGNYLVRLTLYRDCAGQPMPGMWNVDANSASCALNMPFVVSQIANTGLPLPVSTCVPFANCYEEYVYEGTVNLSGCSDWELSFHTCCRNAPNNVISPGSDDFYISTELNNLSYPGNNSPVYNYAAIGTFCINNNFLFDMGATDPDGDNLTYTIVTAMGFNGTPIPLNYQTYMGVLLSPGNPINSSLFSINAATGMISLNPGAVGNFVICIKVEEFDPSTGQLKGFVIRDLQVNVSANCNTNIPVIDPTVLSNGINANCGDTSITILLSANIQCGSVAANGSDFLITDNSGGPNLTIASASGSNCIIGISNAVTIYFPGPLSAGNYTISIQNGTDGNTLLSECGIPMASSNQLQLTATGNISLTLNQLNLTCAGNNSGSITSVVTGLSGPFLYSIDGTNYSSNNIFQSLSAGTYTIYARTSGNCATSKTVTLSEPPALITSVTNINTTCFNLQNGSAALTVNGGTPGYQAAWNTNPVQNGLMAVNMPAGTFNATITDTNGCTAFQQVIINNPDSIALNVTGTARICIGQQANLTATATGGTGRMVYNWIPAMVGGNQTVNPIISTTYLVSATDSNGCQSASKAIEVVVNPGLTLSTNSSQSICKGTTAALSVAVSGGDGGPYQYFWSNGLNGSGQINVSPQINSTYNITVTDGCTTPPVSGQIDIKINPSPVAAFNFNPSPATILHPEVSFINQSKGESIYNWNFGDGPGSSYISDPKYSYSDTGHFHVELIVTNHEGCSDTVSQIIEILPVSGFFLPNAFSPNGDGINDNFQAKGEFISEFALILYNRWGEKVFETTDMSKGWDGNYMGQNAPEGVYSYVIKAKGFDRKSLVKDGNFVLIR